MMIILGVIIAVIVIIIIGKFKKRLFVSVLYVESLVLLVYVVISKV